MDDKKKEMIKEGRKEKVAVIIPCYNEEATISKVITDFKQALPQATIYVADNNSNDKTTEVAKENGAIVMHEYVQGKGNAVLRLFKEVDADIYVMIDGDDTYPAANAQEMIDCLLDYNLNMVVGDRLSNGTYEEENKRNFHMFGNNLIKSLINSTFNSQFSDILSGYRVFSKAFVKNYATLAKGFELETDLNIFALNYNVGIKEVPITYKDRPEGSESKLNTYSDGVRIIMTYFNLFRFYRPLAFFSILSLITLFLALFVGFFPVFEYIKEGFVHKVPSAILAMGLVLTSLLLFISGLILDTIMRIDKKNFQLRIRNYVN